LANNRFTGRFLAGLRYNFPELTALSLKQNDIRSWEDLDLIVDPPWMTLEDLVLSDNPLSWAVEGDDYKR
jgi:hypothetical protein